ncbi:MFS transporter [Sphingomonas sp.]|uniref:MFS transporter n=1 Tax=Sphingomonas sp. TaxID=28214 RepID=UPI003B3AF556
MTQTATTSVIAGPQLDDGSDQKRGGFFGARRAVFLLGALFLVSLIAQVDRMLPFILAEAIKAELLLSDTQIGLITGIAFAVCYALLSLPMARLADQGSPRAVLLGCTMIWSAMTALGGMATGFATLAASRFGVALGEAGAIPSSHAIIARRIRPERRGLALGIFSMGIPLGTMIGFGAGGALGEAYGWRFVLLGAGAIGAIIGIIAFVAAGSERRPVRAKDTSAFGMSSRALLALPAFRAILIAAVSIGFASAPFYAFAATFLIRTHALTATQAGLAFGLLQGGLGIVGTLLGGRGFDAAVRAGGSSLLRAPALAFMVATITTIAALFAPHHVVSIALLTPAMFAFAFTLPYAFGAAHKVAGAGHEAIASSLSLIASGLLGPALGPLLVGAISDRMTEIGVANGLSVALLIVPIGCAATAIACLSVNRRISEAAGR